VGAADNARQRTDIILYSRLQTSKGVSTMQPFVECASCHDPHVSDTLTFLRMDNTGSALCLACHVK